MIEWIQHWDEMRFYYWSGLNWFLLVPAYLGLIVLLGVIWLIFAQFWKHAWVIVIALLPVVAVVPWWEELQIAWNFGQLCKKDAGIFIAKTVEVDGFYDATRPTHAGPRTPQAIESYEKGGYKFYELVYRNRKGGPNKVVHIEKQDGVWTPTVIDQPTARYHYEANIYGSRAAHKITRQESTVTDQLWGEVIGRYVEYGRRSPWFFVSLGEPPYSCDGPDGGPNSKHTRLIYRDVLKPKQR